MDTVLRSLRITYGRCAECKSFTNTIVYYPGIMRGKSVISILKRMASYKRCAFCKGRLTIKNMEAKIIGAEEPKYDIKRY